MIHKHLTSRVLSHFAIQRRTDDIYKARLVLHASYDCDLWFITSQPGTCRGRFVTPFSALWLVVCNMQGANGGLPHGASSFAQGLATSSNPTTWTPPHSLKDLPHHPILPHGQVKVELWLALTSTYELRFEFHSHHWIQNDDLFDLKLSWTIFWHF